MQKVTPLIILECIQFSGRTHSSRHHEAFLARGKVLTKWVCLVHQEAFLSKQRLWSN